MKKAKKGFVVSLVVGAILTSLLFSSCASLKPVPPSGCETAVVYKIPGLLPFGPGAIRLGVVGACMVMPAIKPGVIFGLKASYAALQDQMPRTYILNMLNFISPFVSYVPKVAALLEKAQKYFEDDNLTACDRDVLASLAQNIYHDLTGLNIWDDPGLQGGRSCPAAIAKVGARSFRPGLP